MTETDVFLRLGVALAIGLLLGVERGWEMRKSGEGGRVAGIRTFALVAMLGAAWMLLGEQLGDVLLGFGFLGFALAVVASAFVGRQRARDAGVTTLVAVLLTFALGAIAMAGFLTAASAVAVVASILLGTKPVLHRLIGQLSREELYAVFRLLLISVVVLPVLPNRGFGPWQALNPYAIWWMVVLIASVSLVGYFAVKIAGPRRGLGVTALAGGLVSSTAVTLSYARLGRRAPEMGPLLACGVLLACGTMFLRVLLIATIVDPALAKALSVALLAMGGTCYGVALWLWRTRASDGEVEVPDLKNPFEVGMAVQFGLLLALVMLLAKALEAWFGTTGVYLLAAASGLADVDPITLSLARMLGDGEVQLQVASLGILVAASMNTLVKGVLVTIIERGVVARWVMGTLVGGLMLGNLLAVLTAYRVPLG